MLFPLFRSNQQHTDDIPIFMCRQWNVINWPTQSPDLSPADHVFDSLKARMTANNMAVIAFVKALPAAYVQPNIRNKMG